MLARKVDNTLSLLYISATSRGLPHNITRNLFLLARSDYHWSKRRYLTPTLSWKPHLPTNSPEYAPKPLQNRRKSKRVEKDKWDEIDDQSWGAFAEVLRMAEGRDKLILGRLPFDKRTLKVFPFESSKKRASHLLYIYTIRRVSNIIHFGIF